MSGQTAAARFLLEAGAAVNSQSNMGNMTALMLASAQGHEGAMRANLEAGSALELKDISGRTALLWAAVKGQECAMLLEAGAAVNVASINGMTA